MKSEIRDSQINELFEKVAKKKYGKYLMSIDVKKLRGFTNKKVTFDFPVTALIGPNGGGKTTILGEPQAYYTRTSNPRGFSPKTESLISLCQTVESTMK